MRRRRGASRWGTFPRKTPASASAGGRYPLRERAGSPPPLTAADLGGPRQSPAPPSAGFSVGRCHAGLEDGPSPFPFQPGPPPWGRLCPAESSPGG